MSLLTQYIGPSGPGKTTQPDHCGTDTSLQVELDNLKKAYMANTDEVDRGEKHLAALNRAAQKQQIPAGLQINLKPQVQKKEHPKLRAEWAEAKLEAELRFIDILTSHLRERVIGEGRDAIREASKETYSNIRKQPNIKGY